MRHPSLPLAALVFLAALPAQKIVDVYVAGAGEQVFSMRNYHRGVAVARDGSVWVLVWRKRGTDRHLLLVGSKDGQKFEKPIAMPTQWSQLGSVVADLETDRLHLVWEGGDQQQFTSLYYQVFDCTTRTFVGKPQRLQKATGANNQFHVGDLDFTAQGDLCLTMFTHRSPDRKVWGNGWAGGVMTKKKGADEWSQPRKVNLGFTGLQPNLQVVGKALHFVYRSFGNASFGLYSRTLNLETNKFREPKDHQVMGTKRVLANQELQPANSGCLGRDASGNLYMLFAAGTPSHKRNQGLGQLTMAFARRPKVGKAPRWQIARVRKDPALTGGNQNPLNFCLSRGPGNQVFAVYSLKSEAHRFLYHQVYDNGQSVARPKKLASGPKGAFVGLNGMRSPHVDATILAVVDGVAGAQGRSRVALVARSLPVRGFWQKR